MFSIKEFSEILNIPESNLNNTHLMYKNNNMEEYFYDYYSKRVEDENSKRKFYDENIKNKFDIQYEKLDLIELNLVDNVKKFAAYLGKKNGKEYVWFIDRILEYKLIIPKNYKLLEQEFFNALFVIPRTVGLLGHVVEQKRNDEGLFRLPDDLLFTHE